jgi:hypothetical protein
VAIVIGAVSVQEHQRIREAGYALASFDEVRDLLLRYAGENGDHAMAVWVDCDVTDLLVLDETLASSVGPPERTVKVTVDSVREIAARMSATLADNEAERIAAQVVAHLREVIEDEIAHALDTQ